VPNHHPPAGSEERGHGQGLGPYVERGGRVGVEQGALNFTHFKCEDFGSDSHTGF
jgi:hypothetical protein